jgi:hypothetical protein
VENISLPTRGEYQPSKVWRISAFRSVENISLPTRGEYQPSKVWRISAFQSVENISLPTLGEYHPAKVQRISACRRGENISLPRRWLKIAFPAFNEQPAKDIISEPIKDCREMEQVVKVRQIKAFRLNG